MILLAVAAAAAVFTADQVSKAVVVRRLVAGPPIPLGGGVRLRYVLNANRPGAWRQALSAAALVAIVTTIGWVAVGGAEVVHPGVLLGLGAGTGGAAANLCDRLRRGGVVDFIDVGWWPVFNLADAAIVMGAVTVLVCL